MYRIYLLESPSGKKYIGKTSKPVKKRFLQHCNESRVDTQLARALKKYDPEDWSITILTKCDTNDEANKAEIAFISEYGTYDNSKGYNMTRGGDGLDSETARKIRLEYFQSDAGIKWKQELSERWSENNPGDWSGRQHSEETKAKISKAKLGSVRSKNSREKQGKTMKSLWKQGRWDNRPPPTDDHKRKISQSLKGKTNSENQKEMVRRANSKKWKVTSPDGEVTVIENLRAFCREQNLDQGNLSRGSYKGWKAIKM